MKHLAGGINPDAGIRVVSVYADGSVTVWDKKKENAPKRRRVYSQSFSTYGAAKLWAAEYEETERKMRAKEQPE